MRFKHKIAFIIVYFGEFPWFFKYFLHSSIYNPSIDFIILTDNVPLSTPSENIKFITYSIDQFNKDASKTLNMDIHIERGYKLCDFKPTYGAIFSDLLDKYDFWGYCDIDIIWGNIRRFMTSRLLNIYDVLSARHDYLTGSFALYRNNQMTKELFKQSKDYKIALTIDRNVCFDETNYRFKEFEKRIPYNNIKSEIESMTHVVKRLSEAKKLKAYFDLLILEGLPGSITWKKGDLRYKNIFELMYYHFIKLKEIYKEENNEFLIDPQTIKITRKRIVVH